MLHLPDSFEIDIIDITTNTNIGTFLVVPAITHQKELVMSFQDGPMDMHITKAQAMEFFNLVPNTQT